MQTFDVGEIATISSRWWETDLSPAEPSAITLTVTEPDGTAHVYSKLDMTGSDSGIEPGTLDVWTYLQACSAAGSWSYQFEGTVAGATVTQPVQAFLVGLLAELEGQPCDQWCTWDEVEQCTSVDFAAVGPSVREQILDVTSELFFDLTGRWYTGLCETTRSLCYACRPCWPYRCSCQRRDEIDLGGRQPIRAVTSVTVLGETVDPSLYALIGRRYLARTDNLSWPRAADITDPSSFRASWVYGRLIPPGGRKSAALFAAELAKTCVGSECQLPQRVSSIVREGVTYPIIDSLSMVKEGRTGLYLADLWIEADRQGRRARPGIFVPAAAQHRRSTP